MESIVSTTSSPSRPGRWLTAAVTAGAIVLAALATAWASPPEAPVRAAPGNRAAPAASAGPLASLAAATGWINSPALAPASLQGKVVLVDFWTYSCINCLRTLPYVRAWAEKYRDAGLVVIGVHAPEFDFEHRTADVSRAADRLHLDFPIAQDNDFAIWRAFGNQAWPAFYFVDAQGRVRGHHLGEGGYAESEQLIQRLLTEAGATALPAGRISPQATGIEAASSTLRTVSPETYVGYERASGVAVPGGLVPDHPHDYPRATALGADEWALSGTWTVQRERAVLQRAGGRIAYRFRGRDLHLVLAPDADGHPVRFRVRIDGQPPQAEHGSDIDAQGNGTVDAHRLYQIVRQSTGGERLVEIEFLDAGAQAYAFTFG
jgi:thiol-disulfide isomerase/thioredoxin